MGVLLFEYIDEDIIVHHMLDDASDTSYANRHEFKMHTHDYIELYQLISGNVTFYAEGNEYQLESGDVMVFHNQETHCGKVSPNTPYERITIHFSKDLFSSLDPDGILMQPLFNRNLGENNLYRDNSANNIYTTYFRKLIEDAPNQRFHIRANLLLLLNEINTSFLAMHPNTIQPLNTFAHQIMDYINANLFDNLTLDGIAEKFFISKPQLCRVFKQTAGATVWEYITLKRLLCARDLIMVGFSPIIASLECGFNDYSAFYRSYLKHFGVSPNKHKGQAISENKFKASKTKKV